MLGRVVNEVRCQMILAMRRPSKMIYLEYQNVLTEDGG